MQFFKIFGSNFFVISGRIQKIDFMLTLLTFSKCFLAWTLCHVPQITKNGIQSHFLLLWEQNFWVKKCIF